MNEESNDFKAIISLEQRAKAIIKTFKNFIESVDGSNTPNGHIFRFEEVIQYSPRARQAMETDLRMLLAAMVDVTNSQHIAEIRPEGKAASKRVDEIVQYLIEDNSTVAQLVKEDEAFRTIAKQMKSFGIDITPFETEPMSAVSRTDLETKARVFKTSLFSTGDNGLSITDKSFHSFLFRENRFKLDGRWQYTSYEQASDKFRDEITNRYEIARQMIWPALVEAAKQDMYLTALFSDYDANANIISDPRIKEFWKSVNDNSVNTESAFANWMLWNESRVFHWASIAKKASEIWEDTNDLVQKARSANNSRGKIVASVFTDSIAKASTFSESIKQISGRYTHDKNSIELRQRQQKVLESMRDQPIPERKKAAIGALLSDHLSYVVGNVYGKFIGTAAKVDASKAIQKFDPADHFEAALCGKRREEIISSFGSALIGLAGHKSAKQYFSKLILEAIKEHCLNVSFENGVLEGEPVENWIREQFSLIINDLSSDKKLRMNTWASAAGAHDAYVALASSAFALGEDTAYFRKCESGIELIQENAIKERMGLVIDSNDFDIFLENNERVMLL